MKLIFMKLIMVPHNPINHNLNRPNNAEKLHECRNVIYYISLTYILVKLKKGVS